MRAALRGGMRKPPSRLAFLFFLLAPACSVDDTPPAPAQADPSGGAAMAWAERFRTAAEQGEEAMLAAFTEYAAKVSPAQAQAMADELHIVDLRMRVVLFQKGDLESRLGYFVAAAATYDRLAGMPDADYPASASRWLQALAELELTPSDYLTASDELLAALRDRLDDLTLTLAPDPYTLDLRYRYALVSYGLGDVDTFAAVMEPVLTSTAADDVIFLARDKNLRPSVYAMTIAAHADAGDRAGAEALLRRFEAERLDADYPYLETARTLVER
jgi:hypothetical protein